MCEEKREDQRGADEPANSAIGGADILGEPVRVSCREMMTAGYTDGARADLIGVSRACAFRTGGAWPRNRGPCRLRSRRIAHKDRWPPDRAACRRWRLRRPVVTG